MRAVSSLPFAGGIEPFIWVKRQLADFCWREAAQCDYTPAFV